MSIFQARASSGTIERANPGGDSTRFGSSSGARRSTAVNLLTLAVFAVGLPVLVGVLGGGERLRVLVEQSGPWAPLAYVAAKAAVTIVAPLSGVPLKAASGTLFGFVGGFSYSVLGDVIGGCICFLASRYLGRNVVRLVWDDQTTNVRRMVDRGVGGWRELLFCRITFSAVYNLLSCAAGSTKLPFWQYLAVTTFGGIAHTGFLVTLGASAGLGWEMRAAAYAAITVLAVLALFGGRYLRGMLDRGQESKQRTPDAERELPGLDPIRAGKTYAA